MTDWGLLGGDPAPGDPASILVAANFFEGIAAHARDAGGALSRLVSQVDSESVWTGQSASAWAQGARTVPPDLDRLATSYGEAATAMRVYSSELQAFQVHARRAAEDALAANAELQRAHAQLDAAARERDAAARAEHQARADRDRAHRDERSLPIDADPATRAAASSRVSHSESSYATAKTGAANAASRLASAQSAERSARERLEDARRRAAAVRDSAIGAADIVNRALITASKHGIRNRSYITRTYQDRISLVHYVYTVENFTSALDLVSNAMGTLSFVAMWVPGPGTALAAALSGASAIFSVAALAGHAIMASRHQESWTSVGIRGAFAALQVVGAKGDIAAFSKGTAQMNRMVASGQTITSANRPMALRTATEQYLGDIKRIAGGTNASTVGGFSHLQVGVTKSSQVGATVHLLSGVVKVKGGIDSGSEVIVKSIDLVTTGELEPEVAPSASDLVEELAKSAAKL